MMTDISIFDGEHPLLIEKPLRLIELFAGYGSQSLALKYLGIPHEHYFISEWAVKSIQAYKDMHCHDDNKPYDSVFTDKEIRNYLKGKISADYSTPLTDEQIERMPIDKARTIVRNMFATNNQGSITAIDAKKHPIVGDYTYLLTYSFPCVSAGTYIDTIDGFKPIEDIRPGDYVRTHKNRYRKVLKTMSKISDHYNTIIGGGSHRFSITDEHPMYVLRDGAPQWVEVKNLKPTDLLCYNIPQEETPVGLTDGELWMLGRYVADGHLGHNHSVHWSIGNDKEQGFWEMIPPEMKLKAKPFQKPGCVDVRIADHTLRKWCEDFGHGAKNKRLPAWVLRLPKNQAKVFLDGYLSGDGHTRSRNYHHEIMYSTVSKALSVGLQQLVAKVYHRRASMWIRHDNRKESFNDTYNSQFSVGDDRLHQTIIGDQIFTEYKEIERCAVPIRVYNLEVEEDNSYTADNLVVHNCQDLSMAGLRQGMERGSSTRSGLLWEVERLLNEWHDIGRVPDILLMENVPEVVGTKNRKAWEEWIASLDQLGYKSYWKILNATDYGIPQNRRRCFMVSVQGNYYYDHPSPIGCSLRLKDVLENKVSEDYYLSDETVAKFVRLTGGADNSQTAIVKKGDPNIYPTNIGTTLHARDCKEGKTVGTREGINAVVETQTVVLKKGDPNPHPTDLSITLRTTDAKIARGANRRDGINAVVERDNERDLPRGG